MSLYEKIGEDLKIAMKSGDRARVDALRFALSGINNFQKEKQAKIPDAAITDEELISVLQKEAKRKKESIELFKQGSRSDLVAKEEADLGVISVYLPKELSRDELEKIVGDAITTGSFSSSGDFNSVMRETMKVVKGRADGKTVGEIIKTKLG